MNTDETHIPETILEAYAQLSHAPASWRDINAFARDLYAKETEGFISESPDNPLLIVMLSLNAGSVKQALERSRELLQPSKMQRIAYSVNACLGSHLLIFLQEPFPEAGPQPSTKPLAKAREIGSSMHVLNAKIRSDVKADGDPAAAQPAPEDERVMHAIAQLKTSIPNLTSFALLAFLESQKPLPPDIRQKYTRLFASQFGEQPPVETGTSKFTRN